MTVESEAPLDLSSVKYEERYFGGDIVWWALLLLLSIPVLLLGLANIPDTGGFLALALGGIMAGIGFAQVMLRLPYFTNGFVKSLLIVLVASVIIAGIALLYNMTLEVPNAPPDVLYKPPISGG